MSTLDLPIRPSASGLVRDTAIVLVRELRPLGRDPFSVLFSMVQPLFFLALFGPLLVSASGLGTAASLQWFVPGILVMSALFGSSATGANLLFEMQTGAHERMLVTPLARPALLVGRALKEIVPVFFQAVLIVLVALPFGLHVAPGALLGLVLLAAFAIGLGALSYSLALAVSSQDWIFWTVQQTLIFPLMLLAGMLLPIDDAPGWLQALAAVNPLKHIVDAERALFAGDAAADVVLAGVVSAFAVAAVGLLVGLRAIGRAR